MIVQALCSIVIALSFPRAEVACKYMETVVEASEKYDLEPTLMIAMIRVESNWKTSAISHARACGLTQVLVFGAIFSTIRPKHHFFHCPMCMGFWTGVFLWSINDLTELFNFDYNIINMLLLGCLSSGSSYVLSTIFGDEGIKHEFKQQ